MDAKKALFSVGAAIATSRMARNLSRLDADDMLGILGLSRRRSHLLENLALVTLGAAVGAGAALLFAPNSGSETRARIGKRIDGLGEAASEAMRDVKNELPNFRNLAHAARNGMYTEHTESSQG
jgi:hypothetical protein